MRKCEICGAERIKLVEPFSSVSSLSNRYGLTAMCSKCEKAVRPMLDVISFKLSSSTIKYKARAIKAYQKIIIRAKKQKRFSKYPKRSCNYLYKNWKNIETEYDDLFD